MPIDEEPCTSAKKLRLTEGEDNSALRSEDDGNIIVSMDFLRDLVALIGVCPAACKSSALTIENELNLKMGFAYKFRVTCSECGWMQQITTSKTTQKSTPGQKPYEINTRMVIGFREMGQGFASMETFCRCLNMPPPMSKPAYNKTVSSLRDIFIEVAMESMKRGAEETKRHVTKENEDGPADCHVSVDGTWQRRGHASLNGVVTVISKDSKKCLDFQVVSKVCKACERWLPLKGTEKYQVWKAGHTCPINHYGSSGAMESSGAVQIFGRSIPFLGLRYTGYIGDGDSNSYASVVASSPYGDMTIKKLECVGHIQKRMGNRLRNLRKSLKGTKLSDGKGIAGKGRLTDKIINTIQNYYGLAIRQNIGNLYSMKKAVGAILYHMSENDDNEDRHKFCPRTADSWCKFQADKLTGKSTYKDKIALPSAIKQQLIPIFKSLSCDELLSKCLHGQTQNANEALNKIIWQKCPKTIFASKTIVDIATSSAVLYFNDGAKGLLNVFGNSNITPGVHTQLLTAKVDKRRVQNMQYKSREATKKRRKKLRSIRKGYHDNEKETEGNVYESGGH